ncbi:MAG: uracil-DNA glycosylase [Brumimicrobium sp.]
MDVKINPSWKNRLEGEFRKEYFHDLTKFVKHEYQLYQCYPSGKDIFSAFDACPWDKLKVVIIGQDPYHGKNQANGLCFSVNKGVPFPPSLVNIFKEIKEDLNQSIPENGDLFRWANQGVLLLNATLTVRENLAGSHQKKGWETFTDNVIKIISNEKENIIFFLWGGFAKGKAKLIDKSKHHILSSGHPSPLSANRGYWFGNKHFSKCNSILRSLGMQEIKW